MQSRALLDATIEQHRAQARDKGVELDARRADVRPRGAGRSRSAQPRARPTSSPTRSATRPAGGDVQLRSAPDDGGQVRFEVIDSGEGIDAEMVPDAVRSLLPHSRLEAGQRRRPRALHLQGDRRSPRRPHRRRERPRPRQRLLVHAATRCVNRIRPRRRLTGRKRCDAQRRSTRLLRLAMRDVGAEP